jgi:hypothetical protein
MPVKINSPTKFYVLARRDRVRQAGEKREAAKRLLTRLFDGYGAQKRRLTERKPESAAEVWVGGEALAKEREAEPLNQEIVAASHPLATAQLSNKGELPVLNFT